jgi:hypothetical protein
MSDSNDQPISLSVYAYAVARSFNNIAHNTTLKEGAHFIIALNKSIVYAVAAANRRCTLKAHLAIIANLYITRLLCGSRQHCYGIQAAAAVRRARLNTLRILASISEIICISAKSLSL